VGLLVAGFLLVGAVPGVRGGVAASL
jgi:hypothetical protein